jgi:nucleoside-diphosphate-sugar epimerase
MEIKSMNLKIAITGGSGAVGSEIISFLDWNQHFSKITIITRRRIQKWEILENKEKFHFIDFEEFEELKDIDKETFNNYDAFFCCLGCPTNKKRKDFQLVDYSYSLMFAELAKTCNIPHFSIITSSTGIGLGKLFWSSYLKTKKELENKLLEMQFPYLSIMRPSFIIRRYEHSRSGENSLRYAPFIQTIHASKLADVMILDCMNYYIKRRQIPREEGSIVRIFEKKDLKIPLF